MKRKSKLKSGRAEPSAAQIARLAGISASRVYALRAQGRSDAEIITASAQRRENLALRSLPPVPVNGGNGHRDNVVTFAAAQAEREIWTAKLKQLDYQERSGELVPMTYVRHWASRFLLEARDLWTRGPSELRDQLASESDPLACERIVNAFCQRVVSALYRLERIWTQPPPPPGMAA
jgi:hypothetical protein